MSRRVSANPVSHCSCGAKGSVIDTRRRDTFIYRRHICQTKKCSLRWTTIEHRIENAVRGGNNSERMFRMQVAVDEREALGAALAQAIRGILFPDGHDAAYDAKQEGK